MTARAGLWQAARCISGESVCFPWNIFRADPSRPAFRRD